MSHRTRATRANETGVGAISTCLGATMLLGLLLVALHTMLALQTRSLVTAAAWDAAHHVAVADLDDAASPQASAMARVENLIGRLSPTVRVTETPDTVSVTVTATSPGFFPGVTSLDGVRTVRRTAVVRRERPR